MAFENPLGYKTWLDVFPEQVSSFRQEDCLQTTSTHPPPGQVTSQIHHTTDKMRNGGIIISALLFAGVNAAAIHPSARITTETQTPPALSIATAPIVIIGSQKDGKVARLIIQPRSEEEELSGEDRTEGTVHVTHNLRTNHERSIALSRLEQNSKEGQEENDHDDMNTPSTRASLLPPRDPSKLDADADEGGILHGRRHPKPQLITPNLDTTRSSPFFEGGEFGVLPVELKALILHAST